MKLEINLSDAEQKMLMYMLQARNKGLSPQLQKTLEQFAEDIAHDAISFQYRLWRADERR